MRFWNISWTYEIGKMKSRDKNGVMVICELVVAKDGQLRIDQQRLSLHCGDIQNISVVYETWRYRNEIHY